MTTTTSTRAVSLPVPPGDPAAVAVGAARLRAAHAAVTDARSGLDAAPQQWRDGWQGLTAESAELSVRAVSAAAGTALGPLEAAAAALDRWAQALEDAQGDVRRLQGEADELAAAATRQRRTLLDAIEAARARPVEPAPVLAAPSEVDVLCRRLDRLEVEAAADQDGVRRRADAVVDDLDDVALGVRRDLELTRPAGYRGHRESLQDWAQRAIGDALTTIPVLRRHADTVDAAVWAFLTAPQAATTAAQVFRRARNIYLAMSAGAPIGALRLPLALRLAVRRGGVAAQWFGEGALGERLLIGSGRTAPLWTAVRTGSEAAALETGLLARGTTLTSHVGVLRVAGVGASVVATGASLVNVVAQGNPVDALRENGAGYVADVAELGFNASTTAFLIAPNPVTAGLVVVTGVVWAGAELVDHWDDVSALATDGGRLVADAAGAAVDGLESVGEGAVHAARSIGSALNPFD